jgi:DnaK suppressor protein
MARATTKAAASRSSASKKATSKAGSAKSGSKGAAKANGLDKFLEEQLEALEQERSTYLRQAESLQAEADSLTEDREPGDVQFDEESGEGDTLAVERERDLALSAQARAAIEDIDRAVAKIHDGTYGQCDSCGNPIPKERLKALPYAALCVRCKSGGLGLTR